MRRQHYSGVIEATGDTVGQRDLERFSVSIAPDANRMEGSLPEEHPLEELWCNPDDFIFVKIRVGGYLATTYEFISFQETGTS